MENKIFLSINSIHNFTKIQQFLIDVLIKKYSKKRTLILLDNSPSFFTNIKATLWHYSGYSYPHLNSDDGLADQSSVVTSQDFSYLVKNASKFDNFIVLYASINADHITKIQNKEIFIIHNKDYIDTLKASLLNKNIISQNYDTLHSKHNKKEEEYKELGSKNKNIENKTPTFKLDNKDSCMKKIINNECLNNKSSDKIFKTKLMNQDINANINMQNKEKENKINAEIPQRIHYPDRILFIIKPRVLKTRQEQYLLCRISEQGFLILRYIRRKLSKEFWLDFYQNIKDEPYYEDYCNYLSKDYVILVILYNKITNNRMDDYGDTIKTHTLYTKIRNIIGVTDPKKCEPHQLRRQFGIDLQDNGMHASESYECYSYEMDVLFKHKVYV
jgi:nucleoside-diphosphate kinase